MIHFNLIISKYLLIPVINQKVPLQNVIFYLIFLACSSNNNYKVLFSCWNFLKCLPSIWTLFEEQNGVYEKDVTAKSTWKFKHIFSVIFCMDYTSVQKRLFENFRIRWYIQAVEMRSIGFVGWTTRKVSNFKREKTTSIQTIIPILEPSTLS